MHFILITGGKTKLFSGWNPYPEMEWNRKLTSEECYTMLTNPWQIFKQPEVRPT